MTTATDTPQLIHRRSRVDQLDATEDEPIRPPLRWRQMAVLLLLLPMFGQSFFYVKALPPMWALSKAFPILSLPLALLLFRGERPPFTRQLVLSLLWLVLVPSFAAIFTFQQDFFTGLTAQVKLLPLLYFFSFLGLLRWLKPTAREILVGFVICAAITFILLTVFTVFVPQRYYSGTYVIGDAPFFSSDNRGNRIRMPMFFGIAGIFYWYRRFLQRYRPVWLVLAGIGFGLVMGVVRTRAMVLGLAGVLAWTSFKTARPAMRVALLLLIPALLFAMSQASYVGSVFSTSESSGIDVRLVTINEAMDFLGTSPVRWLFGVGTISPLDPAGLITYFNHFFFLADITWLGVVFEFGIIGAILILMMPVRGLMLPYNPGTDGNPFLAGLKDYLLYTILISPLYPLTLSPGEITAIMAILVYLRELERNEPDGIPLSPFPVSLLPVSRFPAARASLRPRTP